MKFFAQFLSIIFVTVWLYVPLTKYFFFQDDFILFDMANRMTRWQNAFAPSETIFWRPLALGYFWLGQRVFGLDPYRFHLVSLAMHIINVLLVWILVSRVLSFKRSDPSERQGRTLSDSPNDIGWLAGLLFGTSAIHFMSQVWIGEYPIILGLTFWLLTLLVGFEWIKHPTWSNALVTMVFYALGLLTHELTLLLPMAVLGIGLFVCGVTKNRITQLLLMTSPGLLYLLLRLVVFPVNIEGNYEPISFQESMKAVWWYIVWIFNIPEELKYQSFVPFSIRPEFAVNFPLLSWLWRIQLILIPLLGFVLPWFLLKRRNVIARSLRPARNASHSEAGGRGNPEQRDVPSFGEGSHPYVGSSIRSFASLRMTKRQIATTPPWRGLAMTMMISLILSIAGGVILLVALGHQYPFLLSFALIGVVMLFVLFLGTLAHYRFGNVIIGGFLCLWIFSAWSSLRFSEKSHWTVQEALMAERIVRSAKDQFGSFPPGSTVIVPLGIDEKHKAAMADQLGMRIMFKEQNLTTYFGTLQGIQPPECVEATDVAACLLEHRIYRIKV